MDLIQHIAVDFEKYDLNFDIMYEKLKAISITKKDEVIKNIGIC